MAAALRLRLLFRLLHQLAPQPAPARRLANPQILNAQPVALAFGNQPALHHPLRITRVNPQIAKLRRIEILLIILPQTGKQFLLIVGINAFVMISVINYLQYRAAEWLFSLSTFTKYSYFLHDYLP